MIKYNFKPAPPKKNAKPFYTYEKAKSLRKSRAAIGRHLEDRALKNQITEVWE